MTSALSELKVISPRCRIAETLDVDSSLVLLPDVERRPAEMLREHGFTFLHHLAPAELSVELNGTSGDVSTIVAAVLDLNSLAGNSFSVQCRKGRRTASGSHAEALYSSRDIEIAVGERLERVGHTVDLGEPEEVVSVYLSGSMAYIGVSRSIDNLSIQADEHRMASSLGKPNVSRAEYKLREALSAFGVDLAVGADVLDLGASPGGWSYVLAESGMLVTAVDPGELAPRVMSHPNVTQLKMRAEYADFRDMHFDLVVNDMNLGPSESSALMCAVAPAVKPGAKGIMTVKLVTKNWQRGLDSATAVLDHAWHVQGVRHLFHNRQEVTAILVRRRDIASGWERHIVQGRGMNRTALLGGDPVEGSVD